ncbi:Uncharacterised protein [Vibrio cholerae]|nr:Uncharacterised protein [Vibrio cholerae]
MQPAVLPQVSQRWQQARPEFGDCFEASLQEQPAHPLHER